MPFMRGGYFQNEAGVQFAMMFPIFFIVLLDSTFLVPLVEEKQDGLKVKFIKCLGEFIHICI